MHKKFDIEDYRQLLVILDDYDNEASRIFETLRKADTEAKAKVLTYGKNSYIERLEWDYADKDSICIRYYDYGYDLYDSNTIYIPVKIFGNDKLIQAWVEEKIQEGLNKIKEEQKLKKSKVLEFELAEYERLKAKFENKINDDTGK